MRNKAGCRAGLLFFFVILIACNSSDTSNPKMTVEFIRSRELKGYPSGSTISFYDERLYLMGDDALSLLILDKQLNLKEQAQFFHDDTPRIEKSAKADIESSEWMVVNDKATLWLFGSGSVSPQRDSAFCYNPGSQVMERVDLSGFYQQLRNTGIAELNIEAAVKVGETLLFGSRGNLTNPQNYLLVTSAANFPNGTAPLKILLNLPEGAGVSGMSYLPERDILLLTSSKESTATAYDDGEIGESNLGIIYDISGKLSGQPIEPDEWLDLSEIHPDFQKQKIESICTLNGENNEITAILVSDDDKGKTRLFEIKLKM